MDALIRKDKFVLPVAWLGQDAFQVFIDMLERWDELPIHNVVTTRQFLELAMPSRGISTLERSLFAALQSKPVLFVSYRRADVPDTAARIAELLIHRYGRRSVYIDVWDLEPGSMFASDLEDAVSNSRAIVLVIGPRWEGPSNAEGLRRIDQQDDWVARELAIAHEAGCPILPVLVQGRSNPEESALPLTHKWLPWIQVAKAQYHDLEHDLRPVFEVLDKLILPRQAASVQ